MVQASVTIKNQEPVSSDQALRQEPEAAVEGSGTWRAVSDRDDVFEDYMGHESGIDCEPCGHESCDCRTYCKRKHHTSAKATGASL